MILSPKRTIHLKYCSSIYSRVQLLFVGALLIAGVANVRAQSPTNDLVTYPTSNIEFIIGPQLKSGSAFNPYPWFDTTAHDRGLVHGNAFPDIPPMNLTGVVTATSGSAIVTGQGTRFMAQINPNDPAPYFNGHLRIHDAGSSTFREVQVASVNSDTQLTLTASWSYATVSNAVADTYYQYDGGWNYDQLYGLNYYDQVLIQYTNYYRTGEVQYLNLARRIADSWWKYESFKEGTATLGGASSPMPRSAGLAGLMLRAMDGRPEMWDWINRYMRWQFDSWVVGQMSARGFTIDLREASYTQLYATLLAKVLPDSYPLIGGGMETNGAAFRAQYLSQAEDAAVHYWGRFQHPDGSYRWDNPYYVIPGVGGGGTEYQNESPFMNGILHEALIVLYRLTTNPNVKWNIRVQLTKNLDELYANAYRGNETVVDLPPGNIKWRAFFYILWGGTTVVPHLFDPPNQGTQSGNRLSYGNPEYVSNERELNAALHHGFGYAYHITGDPKYRQWGDDVFDASFGGSDGIRNQADRGAKQYNQNYRSSGRYLAWRLMDPVVESEPPPPASSLYDDFNDNARDAAKWDVGLIQNNLFDPTAIVAETSQRLEITAPPSSSGGHFSGYITKNSYNFIGKSARVEVVQRQSPNFNVSSGISVGVVGTGVGSNQFQITLNGYELTGYQRQYNIGGVVFSIPYNSSEHRWWQVRHYSTSNTIKFETSVDGGTWVTRGEVPVTIALNSVKADLWEGSGGVISSPGTVAFDNFALDLDGSSPPPPTPTPTPAPTPTGGETVWVEDNIPAGATPFSDNDSWNWVGSSPSPYSGATANRSAVASGMHQHYFQDATTTLTSSVGDRLFAYVFIDPSNVPNAIMLQWNDGDWDQRAYWGANESIWGTDGTKSRRFMGPLPAAGQWVRLEVPASQVGLEGKTINGMAFTLFGGRASWDRAGKAATGSSANPIDDARNFVRQHYLDFLGREPDSGGWDYWTQQITSCPAGDTACVQARRISVTAAFFVELEFQETGSFVYRFYKSSLGRTPSFAEFLPDRAQVVAGPNLEANKQSLANAWVERTEFLQKYPESLTGTQFIDALLQTVQQSSGADISSQRSALIDDWNAYGSRARIVRMVADMPDFVQAEYNPSFVLMQYFGYLRRDPDPGGYSFWLDVLNNRAPNNHRGMVCAFITSAEYQLRFGAVVTHTNGDCGP